MGDATPNASNEPSQEWIVSSGSVNAEAPYRRIDPRVGHMRRIPCAVGMDSGSPQRAQGLANKRSAIWNAVSQACLLAIVVLLRRVMDWLPAEAWSEGWRVELELAVTARPTHQWSNAEGSILAAIAALIASR